MQNQRITVVPSYSEIAIGFCFLPVQMLLLGRFLRRLAQLLHAPIDSVSLNTVYFLASAVLTGLIFRRLLAGNFRSFREDPKKVFKAALRITLPLYLAASIGVNALITALVPTFANRNDSAVLLMLEENFVLVTLLCAVFAPFVEETLYRGLVFGTLAPVNRAAAYLASTALFCAAHVLGYLTVMTPLEVLLSAVQYVPAGITFCILYEKTDCLWAPMLVHAAANLIGCSVMGLLGG